MTETADIKINFTAEKQPRCFMKIRKRIIYFSVFMLIAFYLPVTLIWTEIIPFRYRFHASAFFLAAVLVYAFIRNHGLRDLGFRTDNLKESMRWNGFFCIAGGSAIYLAHMAGYSGSVKSPGWPVFYIFYILVLVPVQEIVFRGVLFAEMKKVRIASYLPVILISTVTFCFLHIIYGHPAIVGITFCAGLLWGIIYHRHPNIWGVSLSHAVLGCMAIACGLV